MKNYNRELVLIISISVAVFLALIIVNVIIISSVVSCHSASNTPEMVDNEIINTVLQDEIIEEIHQGIVTHENAIDAMNAAQASMASGMFQRLGFPTRAIVVRTGYMRIDSSVCPEILRFLRQQPNGLGGLFDPVECFDGERLHWREPF
jgi:hypothetical protein